MRLDREFAYDIIDKCKTIIGDGERYIDHQVSFHIRRLCGRDYIMVEPAYDMANSIGIFDTGEVECITEGLLVDQMLLLKVLLDIAGMQ